ncbi:MAG: acyl-CoA synthetase [Acidimicrobiia bacterium]|nr:acyl-CoA synthetase [Acidimicrobiia bacterium]
MAYNLADLFEHAVDAVPDRTALWCGEDSRTFGELEARANALAHHLQERGIGPGHHVGIYGHNSIPWVEAMLAALKLRAVPVNINYRYVTDELRYLFDNADLRGLVFDRQFAPAVAELHGELPLLEALVAMEDPPDAPTGAATDDEVADAVAVAGAVDLDEVAARCSPERDFAERSGDDVAIIYTGGTTGMPKGVMWRSEDIFFALCGGTDPFTREPVPDELTLAAAGAAAETQLVFCTTPPLMHGAAFCATLMQLFGGNQNVLITKFEPREVWRTISRRRANSILITGDAMARPLIEALEAMEQEGEELDVSCVVSLSSSAAVFSPTVKDRFLERFENLVLTDSIGSTESGFNGILMVGKGATAMRAGGPTVSPGRDAVVLDDHLQPVAPGSGVIGRLGRGGNIPIGYYKDPERTAATFVTAPNGQRYAVPGDFASLEEDGSITLLGRGSTCINSGGEKIYPEEVESALKAHADVFDALVVGIPDERWGQRVVAVVQPRQDAEPTLEALRDHLRPLLAAYKLPKDLHLVEEIRRSPSGKPDYPWAASVAADV